MDIKEMREKLRDYCRGEECESCIVYNNSRTRQCISSYSFVENELHEALVSDSEVERCYDLVFGNEYCDKDKEKTMDINEKRERLYKHCESRPCEDCKIHEENQNHMCGNGYSFDTSINGRLVPYSEVERCYDLVFGTEESKKVDTKKVETKKEEVNHPNRYSGTCSIECIEVMKIIFGRKAVMYFCLCNAFKYMWRYKEKNWKEDIDKTKWYLDYVKRDCDMITEVPKKIVKLHDRLLNLYLNICKDISNHVA